MDTTIDQQVEMDEALIPHAHRLRIRRSNFRLLLDIFFKESTLQLVYDVMRLTPFFKAFLVTADVEHKDTKKRNEMYYPRFTKTRSSFDTKVTPTTAAAGPRLSTSTKCKQPATTSKAKSLSALLEVAMTEAQQLKLATKRSLQQTHISQANGSGADEGTGSIPGVPDLPTDESEEEISWNSTNEEGDDDNDDEGDDGDDEFIHPSLSTHAEEEPRDEESFDPILKTPKNTDDEGNGEENLGINVGKEEGQDKEDEEDELYRDVSISLGRGIQMADVHTTQEVEDSHVILTLVNPDGQQHSSSVSSQFVTSILNPTTDVGMESIFKTTSQMDVQTPTLVAPLPISSPTLTLLTISTITTTLQAPTPPTTAPSTLLQDLPNFGSLFRFGHRLKTLKENFSEFTQTNQFAGSTSYAVAADLSKMELKKILIEKIEGNKSIHRSNKQRNLYKALVEAYESNKIILDTYGDTITLKRCRDDDADKDEEASAGSNRGYKRRREGKEPESTSTSESATVGEPIQTTFEMEEPSHLEFEIGADDQPIVEPSQHPEWFS
nr:hypothetical protein [Tanacetum cinerariifolium]